MAKKCPKCECPAGEKWAVPFADFLSLLLALFIALYALASVNVEKQAALKEEFIKIYGLHTKSEALEEPQEDEQVAMTQEALDEVEQGKNQELDQAVARLKELENENTLEGNLNQISDGTFMTLPANLLFEAGESQLTSPYAIPFLKRISRVILMMPTDTEINIKGYADEDEVKIGGKYQDALELSTARANSVVRELIRYKVSKDRLFSSGYGSSLAIKGAADQNRRVEFELKTMNHSKRPTDMNTSTIFDRAANE